MRSPVKLTHMKSLLILLFWSSLAWTAHAEQPAQVAQEEDPQKLVDRLKQLILQKEPDGREVETLNEKIIKQGKKAAPALLDLLLDEKTCRQATWALCQMTHSRMLTAPMSGWDTPYEGEQLKEFHWTRTKSAVEFLANKKLGDIEKFPGKNSDEKTVAAMKALLVE